MFDRIVQVSSNMIAGDGITNLICDYAKLFTAHGIDNRLVSVHSDGIENVLPASELESVLTPKTLILFHNLEAPELYTQIPALTQPRIFVFHNITPPIFFKEYDKPFYDFLYRCWRRVAIMAPFLPYAWGDSQYNCAELKKIGYLRTEEVCPTCDFDRFAPFQRDSAAKRDGVRRILFVGRIAPNKRQEDVIRAFSYYHQLNPNSTLTLVGSTGLVHYAEDLERMAKQLNLPVEIPSKVSTEELVAYYQNADLFLCMSEHEGLCIPLWEAMHFGVPVVAFASSAVAETVGDGGILFHQKHFPSVAQLMHALIENEAWKQTLVEAGRQRISRLNKTNNADRVISLIEEYAAEMDI